MRFSIRSFAVAAICVALSGDAFAQAAELAAFEAPCLFSCAVVPCFP